MTNFDDTLKICLDTAYDSSFPWKLEEFLWDMPTLPRGKNNLFLVPDLKVSNFLRIDSPLLHLQSVFQGLYDDFFGSWQESIVIHNAKY